MRRFSFFHGSWWIPVLSVLALAGCGTSPVAPPAPPERPSIFCPASQQVTSTGGRVVVQFAPPTVTGGAPPVTTSCSAPSGGAFPAGRTSVICTATDALNQSASCVFQVDVDLVPALRGTRFFVFGDSITDGEVGNDPSVFFHDPTIAYPADLDALLQARYRAQTISMEVRGMGGEMAADGTVRLSQDLASGQVDALLILEGVNDLDADGVAAIGRIRTALQADIQIARSRGVQIVLLSTLPPQTTGIRAYAPDAIAPANDMIRTLSAASGVALVDTYGAFSGRASTLIGDDGLHPTRAGHEVIAETFLAAIEANFETTPAPSWRRR